MLQETRLQKIMDMLQNNGEVKTTELCSIFGVSDMTIRRDLNDLAERFNVIRTRGGATLPNSEYRKEPQLNQTQETPEKVQISMFAQSLIHSGQRLFIDSGSTTRCFASHISAESSHIIATNNLNVAITLADRENISVVVAGGELRGKTYSCYGSLTEELIRSIRVDVAFLGASSLGEDGWLYDNMLQVAGVKKAIIQSSNKTYALIDSSKINRYGMFSYSNARDITGIVTDKNITMDVCDNLRRLGVNVMIAE